MMIVDAEFDVCIISIVRSFGDLPTTSSGCSWKHAVLKCNDQHQSPAGTTAHVADDLAGRPDIAFSEFRNPVAGLSAYLRCNGSSPDFSTFRHHAFSNDQARSRLNVQCVHDVIFCFSEFYNMCQFRRLFTMNMHEYAIGKY